VRTQRATCGLREQQECQLQTSPGGTGGDHPSVQDNRRRPSLRAMCTFARGFRCVGASSIPQIWQSGGSHHFRRSTLYRDTAASARIVEPVSCRRRHECGADAVVINHRTALYPSEHPQRLPQHPQSSQSSNPPLLADVADDLGGHWWNRVRCPSQWLPLHLLHIAARLLLHLVDGG